MPLENALNGTPGLKTIRSKSVLGLSSVVLIFEEGTDLLRGAAAGAGAAVASRRRGCRPSARPPVILPPLSSTSRVLKIGVSSKTLSQMDLTMLAQWTIRPRLMAIPGVANVAIWGQRDRQYQVLVDPDRLRANGVTLDAVRQGRGRRRRRVGRRRLRRHAQPAARRAPPRRRSMTPEDLARDGRRLPQRGARCGWATWPRSTDRLPAADRRRGHQRRPRPAADRREAADGQHARGDPQRREGARGRCEPGLKGVEIDPTIFRPATFIERSLDNLARRDAHRLRAGRRHPGRRSCSTGGRR